jgi:hypothetical protein
MHRVPSINLRLDPALLAAVRELAGPGNLTSAVDEALQLWLDHQRAGPADAAAQPVPVPAVAAPAPAPAPVVVMPIEPPRSSLPAMLPLPPNAYRPPGR